MSLKTTAQETLAILEGGGYRSASGQQVALRELVDRATQGTRLYRPGAFSALAMPAPLTRPHQVEVTGETTAQASRRLAEADPTACVAALNFASARKPGGGFINGAKAQEEDLTRCSALYPCLMGQPEYYEVNRARASHLYTDHLIYSPDVPFFRDDTLQLLERPFCVSVITAPAPNAGEVRLHQPQDAARVRPVLFERAENVLRVAAHHGHRTVVLGAWGCGVFRNEPAQVAEAFEVALEELAGAFERVVFAVYDPGRDQPNLRAFRQRFGP